MVCVWYHRESKLADVACGSGGLILGPPCASCAAPLVPPNPEIQEAMQGLYEAMQEFYEECSSDNWDGYGAQAVTEEGYAEAKRFCSMLPQSTPIPDVTADPDGEIAFEWREGNDSVFSVSVSPDGLLTYAGIFGPNRAHGVEGLGDTVPEVILMCLRRLCPSSSPDVDHTAR